MPFTYLPADRDERLTDVYGNVIEEKVIRDRLAWWRRKLQEG